MSSADVVDVTQEVDLSKLIDVGLSFNPLQLLLQNLLKRLGALEAHSKRQDEATGDLDRRLAELEKLHRDESEAMVEHLQRLDSALMDSKAARGNSPEGDWWAALRELQEHVGVLDDRCTKRKSIADVYTARRNVEARSGSAGDPSGARGRSARPGGRATSSAAGLGVAAERVPSPADSPSDGAGARRPSEKLAEDEGLGGRILRLAEESLETLDCTVVPHPPPGSSARGSHTGTLAHEQASADPTSSRSQPFDDEANAMGASRSGPLPGAVSSRKSSHSQDGEKLAEGAGSSRGTREELLSRAACTPSESGYPSASPSQSSSAKPLYKFSDRQSDSRSALPMSSPSYSVCDQLRRDNDDIKRLNHVVAEILSHMKDLQENVSELKAVESSEGEPAAVTAEELDVLKRAIEATDEASRQRDEDLQSSIDALGNRVGQSRRSRASEDSTAQLQDELQRLKEELGKAQLALNHQDAKLQSMLEMSDGMGGEGGAGVNINPLQFAALQGAVQSLEKQLSDLLERPEVKSNDDLIAVLQQRLEAVEDTVETLGEECAANHAECDRLEQDKLNKSDAGFAAGEGEGGSGASTAKAMDDLSRRIDELYKLNDALAGKAQLLEEKKTDHAALQRVRDDLAGVRRLLDAHLSSHRTSGAGDSAGEDANRGTALPADALEAAGITREEWDDVLGRLARLEGDVGTHAGVAPETLDNLRDMVDRLDKRKADAALVANKAERDYVENALERLMREIEQVINATNAGLIDTLDKSLNILRDLIDGKATKNDVSRLQRRINDDYSLKSSEGVIGYYSYRCLGCNRSMENMRPRPGAPTMPNFLNRVPPGNAMNNYVLAGASGDRAAPSVAAASGRGKSATVRVAAPPPPPPPQAAVPAGAAASSPPAASLPPIK